MLSTRKIIAAGVGLILLALPLRAEPVMIFAASSLKTALDEVIAGENLDAVAVYGGSAAIARQVAQGAGADIVILAHPDWMDWLEAHDLLAQDSRCDLLGNELVLAGAVDRADLTLNSADDLIAALDGERLATGQLESVPAGQYAADYLRNKGWLAALTPHLAQTSNVRLALSLIARGETPLGFVYASDVAAEPRVRVVFAPLAADYAEIRYPLALVGEPSDGARAVAHRLASARLSFTRNGFSALALDDPERCS